MKQSSHRDERNPGKERWIRYVGHNVIIRTFEEAKLATTPIRSFLTDLEDSIGIRSHHIAHAT